MDSGPILKVERIVFADGLDVNVTERTYSRFLSRAIGRILLPLTEMEKLGEEVVGGVDGELSDNNNIHSASLTGFNVMIYVNLLCKYAFLLLYSKDPPFLFRSALSWGRSLSLHRWCHLVVGDVFLSRELWDPAGII